MPWLSAFLLMAQAAPVQGSPNARVEIPVLHRRPSKISGFLNEIGTRPGSPRVLIIPDDRASTLTLEGPTEEIAEVRRRIALFDTAPRRLRLAVYAESPIDHAEWKAEVEMANNVAWSGSDDATGLRLRVSPRVNGDGSCTFFVNADSTDASSVEMVFRVKVGEAKDFSLPLRGGVAVTSKADLSPRFTLKYLGD